MARIFASAASVYRTGALAAVLAIGVAVSAASQARAAEGGWYMGLNVPVMFIDDTESKTTGAQALDPQMLGQRIPYKATATSEYKAGFKIAGVVGYELGGGFRVEGELFYARAKVDKLTYSGVNARGMAVPGLKVDIPVSGAASQLGGLANIWYDFRTGADWTPYIGGGFGLIRVDQSDLEYDANQLVKTVSQQPQLAPGISVPEISTTDSAFAYHFGVGVGYRLNENTTLQIGYRLQTASGFEFSGRNASGTVDVETDLRAHLVEIGFRTRF